jgi:RNA polymerase sigma-70 factor (ECF subfamily)
VGHDHVLLARIAEGHEEALGELYDAHGATAYAVAYRIVGQKPDAEEVVAESFAQAWREASRFDRARGSVAAWLVAIVRTRALDAALAAGRQARLGDVAAPWGEAGRRDGAATGTAAAGARGRAVREAMAQLTAAQREAIELAFYGGLAHPEIADRLQVPPGTVMARLRLGMQKLRETLASWTEAPSP